MRLYRVHVSEERCADVIVRADNSTKAEELAVTMTPLDWTDYETNATDVTEIDEDGNEIS